MTRRPIFESLELGAVISLRRGHDLSESQRKPGSIPVVSSSGITGFHNAAICDGPGVVTGRYGTLGLAHYVNEPYWPLNTTLYVENFKGNDPRYVSYLLGTLNLAQYNGAGAVPGVNRNVLHRLSVLVPSYDVQVRIVANLSTYDHLIENNQRRIKLLEEAARRLYREWFVALRFPGHERVTVVDGVPQGWKRAALADVIEINPRTRTDDDLEHPFVPMQALSESSMVIADYEMRVPSGGAKFRNGDTLLARITPCLENGKTGFVQFLADGDIASGSTEFIVLRSGDTSPYWVYCLARDESFRDQVIRSMVGSDGRQRVNTRVFDQYLVLNPPQSMFEAFDRAAQPMFEQVEVLTRQFTALKQARDALLPRLMSGALAV